MLTVWDQHERERVDFAFIKSINFAAYFSYKKCFKFSLYDAKINNITASQPAVAFFEWHYNVFSRLHIVEFLALIK
jgi:hypothetical protein